MGRPSRRPRGSGHIYRRGTIWWLAYHVKGKLVRESSGTDIKSEAEKVLRARTAAMDQGKLTDPAAMRTTLEDLGSIVATDYKNNGLSSGREVTRGYARLGEFFGDDCLARSITSARVEEYKAKRLKDVKPSTVNRELAALRRGFRLAHRYGKVPTRPDFSLLKENNIREGFFEADQFRAVHGKLPAHLKLLATFLYWTGWRKNEATRLQWRQVDLNAGVIRIHGTKNREPRTIPYGALPVLKNLFDQQHKDVKELERKKARVIPWVFHRGGKQIKDFLGAWHVACGKAGLAGRIPHDFRRSAARNMLRVGIPQAVAMKIGGWKTDSVFRRYAIVDENMLAENIKKLDDGVSR